MDDYVLYLTRDKFPPPAQSSLSGKRHTARISVVDQPCEDGLQGKNTNHDFFLNYYFQFHGRFGLPRPFNFCRVHLSALLFGD